MNISIINQLRNQAKVDLNTIVGIDQMQYLQGFESAIENIYLESNRYRDIDGNISEEACIVLLRFIMKLVDIVIPNQNIYFFKGQLKALLLTKEVIENSLVEVLK
jgi:hypothetical protein